MNEAFTQLYDKLQLWKTTLIEMLPNILVALLLIFISIIAARLLKKLFLKLSYKVSNNEAINKLLSNIVTVIVFTTGLFIALGILHLDKTVTSLLAGAGVVGLAIGLAFQDPILNVISGIIMSVREPFKIGDLVKSNGYLGHIQRISLRSTTIKKLSGEDVIIPNKLVVQHPLENFTLTRNRRIEITCGVGYSEDLDECEQVAIEAIKESIDYDTEKPIDLIFNEFANSSINFTLRFWIDTTRQQQYLKTKSNCIKTIKKAFDKNGITIPYPIRTIEFSGN